jgi:hypothetical protein
VGEPEEEEKKLSKRGFYDSLSSEAEAERNRISSTARELLEKSSRTKQSFNICTRFPSQRALFRAFRQRQQK